MYDQNFQDAPHRNAIIVKIVRMLRTGGRSARERDFHLHFQDAPHGSAMFVHGSAIFLKIFETLRTGVRFFSKFSAWVSQNFQDAPHGSFKIFRTLRAGTRFSSKEDDLERISLV